MRRLGATIGPIAIRSSWRAALTMAVEKRERMTADVRAGLLARYDNWANRELGRAACREIRQRAWKIGACVRLVRVHFLVQPGLVLVVVEVVRNRKMNEEAGRNFRTDCYKCVLAGGADDGSREARANDGGCAGGPVSAV